MKISKQGITSICFLLTILGIVILTSIQFELEGFGKGCHQRAKNRGDWYYKNKCTVNSRDFCGTWDVNKKKWDIEERGYRDNETHRNYALYRKRLLEQYMRQIRRWQFPSNTPRHIIHYRNQYNWYNRRRSDYYHAFRRERNRWRRRHYYNVFRHYDRLRNDRARRVNHWVNSKIRAILSHPQHNNWWTTTKGWQNRADHHLNLMGHHQRQKNIWNNEMLKQECDWERFHYTNSGHNSKQCWIDSHKNHGHQKRRCDNFWKNHFQGKLIENDGY